MTTDRTAAPVRPTHAERPAARAASLPRDAAPPDAPTFVLTVTPAAAPPASVPLIVVASAFVPPTPAEPASAGPAQAAVLAPTGAVAASARMAARPA